MDIVVESSYKTPLSNSPLLPFLLLSLLTQKYFPDCTENFKDEYDYIVVGSGAAGSVVASRLSEVPCVTVLVLEAGHKPPIISEVPALEPYLLGTDVDWQFVTVPQKYAASGMKYRQIHLPAGKMMGGSGNINAMNYVRGNHKNYDDWAALGAKGWSYKDVFPYFLRLEDNTNIEFLYDGYHAFGGPMTISQPPYYPEIKKVFYDAITGLGYKFVDSNGAHQTGFYDYQMNIRYGQRCSSLKGYLVPADYRPNLDIVANATVTKVLIEDCQAKGVQFYHNGVFREVKARKEVILSAGSINTPKILMLSGIGPREELDKWQIPSVANLPVGKNFQDHGASFYFFTVDQRFGIHDKYAKLSTIEEYISRRSGPLTSLSIIYIAFLNGLNVVTSSDFPNYQLYINEVERGSEQNSPLIPEVYRQLFGPIGKNRTIFACVSQLLQPGSRGYLTLSSPNPFDPPVINPNYLQDPEDVKNIVDGFKMCKKLLNTEPLKRIGAKPFETLMPGCEMYANSDEDYFSCYVKRITYSIYHYASTATMGDPSDLYTVVDPELRVKGIIGLRVVDASVMPLITSGNTNIPTIMIAEKASDIIKGSIMCPLHSSTATQNTFFFSSYIL